MTNSSPQNPPPSPEELRIRQQIRRRTREEIMDEWIAILVAFGTIGAILWWSLGLRNNRVFSTQWNKDFAYSGDTIKSQSNLDLDRQSLRTTDDLKSQDSIFRVSENGKSRSQSFLDDDLYTVESSKPERRVRNFIVGAAPIAGTAIPKATVPEVEVEPEATVPEVEAEPKATVPEVEAEPEATVPEVEAEPEATVPEVEAEPEATVPEVEEEPKTVVSFDDVTEEHWAYPFLQELGTQDFIAATSDNNFEPDALITRAGMANLISQAFDEPATTATKNFKDIEEGNVIAENIDEAVGIGFMKGYSDDEFRPAENIPRYQVLVALATGLGLSPSGDPVTILQNFGDRDKLPKWSVSQVAAATEAGLAVNRPGFELNSLNPEQPATRAEVAAMIYQALLQQGKVQPVESSYIVPKP